MTTKPNFPIATRIEMAAVSIVAVIPAILTKNPVKTWRTGRSNYVAEMSALQSTREIMEKMEASGELRHDMTIFELKPIWDAELDRQRALYQK